MPEQGKDKQEKEKREPSEKHNANPFYRYIPNLKLKVETEETEIHPVINVDTGEIKELSTQGVVTFDMKINCSAKFVKLITDNMRMIASLPLGARRLLDVIIIIIQMEAQDKDYFYMNYEQAKGIGENLGFKLSRGMFQKGVNYLVDGKIIAKSMNRSQYWLNVGVIFNGEYRKLEALRQLDTVHFCEGFNASQKRKRLGEK